MILCNALWKIYIRKITDAEYISGQLCSIFLDFGPILKILVTVCHVRHFSQNKINMKNNPIMFIIIQ